MIQIPFVQYPSYTKEIILEENTFIFSFVWNTRGEFWTLTIMDTQKNFIINGIKLVLNYNLFQDYKHLDIPQGNLYVIDLSNDVSKIKYDDFTNERTLSLIYQEVADLVTV